AVNLAAVALCELAPRGLVHGNLPQASEQRRAGIGAAPRAHRSSLSDCDSGRLRPRSNTIDWAIDDQFAGVSEKFKAFGLAASRIFSWAVSLCLIRAWSWGGWAPGARAAFDCRRT